MKEMWLVVRLGADNHLPNEIWDALERKVSENVGRGISPSIKIRIHELGKKENRPCMVS